jgi:hypothetical protein
MSNRALGAVLTAAVLLGCHTITEELPTEPTEAPSSGVLTVPIPGGISVEGNPTTPAPTPTPPPTGTPTPPPSPNPTPEPTPVPTPEPPPPSAGTCGSPLPPGIAKVKVKIHLRGPNKYTLDSTPLVGGAAYCTQIGFTDGRSRCPVRPEGHPEREACEAYAVGHAADTGRAGPTWRRNGSFCTGPGSGCENHPGNQYLLWAYKGGTYQACAQNGICGQVEVDR